MKAENLKALALAGMLVAVSNPVDVCAQIPCGSVREVSYHRHGCCYGDRPMHAAPNVDAKDQSEAK